MWALSDARSSGGNVASDAGGTEVDLREVAVGASVVSAGVALSVVVGVGAVGEETGQADVVGAAGCARVQAHLADGVSTCKHEVSEARGADVGGGALKAVGDVAQDTLSTDQAVSGLADGAEIVGLAGEAVGDVAHDTGVTIGRGEISRSAGGAESIEGAALAVGDQTEGIADVVGQLIASIAVAAGASSTRDTVADTAIISTEVVGGIIGEVSSADTRRRVGIVGSSVAGTHTGVVAEDEVSVASLAGVGTVASSTATDVTLDADVVVRVKSEHRVAGSADSGVLVA